MERMTRNDLFEANWKLKQEVKKLQEHRLVFANELLRVQYKELKESKESVLKIVQEISVKLSNAEYEIKQLKKK